MEEEWDLIESTQSSVSNNSQQQKSLLELNFNRFINQPDYELEEDEDFTDYDQQLIDQGVIFSESPPPKVEINFKLTDEFIDDVKNTNNQPEQRINQFKNNPLVSFFPSIIMNNNKDENTRESNLDKNAVWENSITGSSVPYMSEETKTNQSYPNFNGKLSFSINDGMKQLSSLNLEEINKKMNNMQLKDEEESIQNDNILSRPIKPFKSIKRNNHLSLNILPSYACTPKSPPVLIQETQLTIDIPPETNQSYQIEQNPDIIKENLSKCFKFHSQNTTSFTSILYQIESISSDITQWYQLKTLNLSKCNLINLNRLDTCFPILQHLIISHNNLETIYGLPKTLITLDASHNKLRDIDIYQLSQLLELNVSHNSIQSFQDMIKLTSLRTLDASDNVIDSCISFQNMTHLQYLSLKSNRIQNFSDLMNQTKQHQLESLNLSFNRIVYIDCGHSLNQLKELNLNHNDIKYIRLDQSMSQLCCLKLCFNRLKSFDVSLFPKVKVLYLDDNRIEKLIGFDSYSNVESFSIRDQGRQVVEYNLQYLCRVRNLYLSGSPFKNMHQLTAFYSLEYLELCSTELKELPIDFSKRVPNLGCLYLSMNNLKDIRPLKKLKKLRKLIIIDNKLSSFIEVLQLVSHLKGLKVLDLRQNPICSNFYPTINLSLTQLYNENEKISPYLAITNEPTWIDRDLEYYNQLSDHWKTRRDVYRALIIKECVKLKQLDHLTVTSNDRQNAENIIDNYQQTRAA